MIVVDPEALKKAVDALIECVTTATDSDDLRIALPMSRDDAEQRILAMIGLSTPPGAIGVIPRGTFFTSKEYVWPPNRTGGPAYTTRKP